MRLSPEYGIDGIDTTAQPDLTRREIEDLIVDVHAGNRLSVARADQSLETDFDPPQSRLRRRIGRASSPPVLIGGAVAAKAALALDPDASILGTMPDKADIALRAVESSQPFVNITAASASVAQHVPAMLLAAGLMDGGRRLWSHGRSARLAASARETQNMLRERIDEGTQAWDFSEASNLTVALVGNGGATSGAIAKSLADQIVQISYKPVKGVNVVVAQEASDDECLEALDRSHITAANQVLIFPNAADDEVFSPPGNASDAYDMGVDRTVSNIRRIDRVCRAADIALKPIVVVGNRRQTVTYVTAEYGGDTSNVTKETLGGRMAMLEKKRGCSIEVIDTTELVVHDVRELADGRPLVYHGEEKSAERFSQGFHDAVRDPYAVYDSHVAPVRCVYNLHDRSTRALAQPGDPGDTGDIAIIHEPPSKLALVNENKLKPERVLVVSELVQRALKPYLDRVD